MNWWKNAVVYQIYPKSFYDSNGDGIGDLKGINEKVEYLANLGVNAIWISPFFMSPMVDNGYDVQDYKNINPIFGTMKDFKQLKKNCEKYNIKIIVDFVANHTSNKHKWFLKALAGNKKYRNYYFFREQPIKEKKSVFGGEAWEKINNEYYLHSFAVEQPDLDWSNIQVRKEFWKIMNFWINKGIGGVRFDVIDDIGKILDPKLLRKKQYIDLNKLHSYVQEWRRNSKWNKNDYLMVGEAWDSSIGKAILYTSPKRKELSMVFGFEHISSNWSNKPKWECDKLNLVKFKSIINKWQVGLFNKGWMGLFLCNHDLPRMVSNFGDDKKYHKESAKCLAATIHFLQGTPFIYQGEEIGMTNCSFNSLKEHDDIEIHQMYKAIKEKNPKYTENQHLKYVATMNRDNARTPMQWNDQKNAGFTIGRPWIKVNDNYEKINVSSQLNDEDSIFNWYKKLITFRKSENELSNLIINGSFNLLEPKHNQLFVYKRAFKKQSITVIANWSSQNVKYDTKKINSKNIILNNYKKIEANNLKPWQVIVITE